MLGTVPVLHPSRWSWSFHLFLGRPMLLLPFGLYFSTCLSNLSVPTLSTCCSHSRCCCFISKTMFCTPSLKTSISRPHIWQPWWRLRTLCRNSLLHIWMQLIKACVKDKKFTAPVQTGPGAHPASCTIGTGSFPGVKRPGRGVDHPPHLAPKLKNE
jgi:hypothetical protein